MKKVYVFTFLFMFSFSNVFSQSCYPFLLDVSSQLTIDNFPASYPGCAEIIGDVDLSDELIINLDSFINVTSIIGNLKILSSNNLTDLHGLGNLTSISGDLLISNCDNLTDLQGLENLIHIGGDIRISGCDNLTSLQGLTNLTSVGGEMDIYDSQILNLFGLESLNSIVEDLVIRENAFLENLSGLENLESVGGISISNNDSLKSINQLENINIIEEHIFITGNNSLLNLSGLNNLTFIGGQLVLLNTRLNDISALSNLDTIGLSLLLSNNDSLENLIGLENLIFIGGLSLGSNKNMKSISSLSNLDAIGGGIFIDNNSSLVNLNGLEGITSIHGQLMITMNDSLSSLQGLTNVQSIDNNLRLAGNPLLNNLSGLKNVDTIGGDLRLYGMWGLINLDGLDSLKIIQGSLKIEHCNQLNNLSGIENLSDVQENLVIYYNNNLSSLIGLDNLNFYNLTNRIIAGNENLSQCDISNFCNYLFTGTPDVSLELNAPGCNSIGQIENLCSENYSKVLLYIFYDVNQNKVKDSLEQYMPLASINILPTNQTFYSASNFGDYIFLDDGNYEMELNQSLLPDWSLVTDSSSYHINIDSTITCDTISFGLYPTSEISNTISFVTGPPARCGEFKTFEAHAKNLGTTITNGTIWLEIDELIDSAPLVGISDTIVAPNLYGWHFENLYPGYTFDAAISLEVPIPPYVMIGDSLRFNSFVEYSDVNGIAMSDNFYYPTEVRCSFDPNDKLVNPSRNNNLTLFEEDLIYTIRFQNTGNDEAYDIIIRDTLDGSLDPTTFRVLSTSHPNSLITTMEEEKFLTFNFENIYLPDSTTNFEASQGYVSYLIIPKEGLAEETLIENTASIYFDFNPPIVTNTTESVMVSEFPTTIHQIGGEAGMKIEIFPNPVSDNFFIKKEKSETLEYQITDVNGRVLMNGILVDEIHNITFTKMNSGVYFIKIINPVTREFFVEKIVK